MDTTWRTNDNLGTILKSLHILANVGTTNTSMALNVHEVTDGNNNLLDLLRKLSGRRKDQSLASLELRVDLLEARDGESCSLASSRLGLCNDIGSCKIASVMAACVTSDSNIYP